VDLTPPSVSLTAPPWTTSLTFTVNTSAWDNVGMSPSPTITVVNTDTNQTVGTGTLPSGGGYAQVSVTLPSLGTYHLQANATDLAGNIGYSPVDTVQVVAGSGGSGGGGGGGGGPYAGWTVTGPGGSPTPAFLDSDPQQGMSQELLGNLSLQHGLTLDHSPGSAMAGDMALVYNSRSTDPQPVIQAVINSPNTQSLPASFTMSLTWDNTVLPLQTFNTSGFHPGDVMIASEQVTPQLLGAPITTGAHTWQLAVNIPGQTPFNTSGTEYVVSQDGSPFGPGWTLSGIDGLVPVAGGLLLVSGTGGQRFFATGSTVNGITSYVVPAIDTGSLLTYNSSTTLYCYELPDGWQEFFNASGNETALRRPDQLAQLTFNYTGGALTSMTAMDGATTVFNYGGGLLRSLVTDNSRTVTLSYNGTNDLAAITDPDGRTENFSYYSNSHLLTGETYGALADSWTFDTTARMLQQLLVGNSSSLAITSLTPEAHLGLRTSTPARGPSQASETDPAGTSLWQLNPAGQPVYTTDPDGGHTSYNLDAHGWVTAITDPMLRTTTYALDGYDYTTLETLPDGHTRQYAYQTAYGGYHALTSFTDENNHTTQYAYDSLGHLTQVTDAANEITRYGYDPSSGEMITVTDPRGFTTTFAYDGSRRLTQVTQPLWLTTPSGHYATENTTYDTNGYVSTVSDALGRVTTFHYDPVGRLTLETNALQGNRSWTYDPSGLLTAVTDERQAVTAYGYDTTGRGLVTLVIEAQNTGAQANTGYAYDNAGRVTAVTDARNFVTSYQYDPAGRLLAVTDPDQNTTRTAYDADGEVTSRTDPTGVGFTYTYTNRGWLSTVTDSLLNTSSFTYDGVGNELTVTDPLHHTTSTAYDNVNRPTLVTDPLGNYTATGYDNSGNVSTVTDPRQAVTVNAYDPLNRLTSVTEAYNTLPLMRTTTYAYDAVGNLTAVTDPLNHATQTAYDALNRPTLVTDAMNDTVRTTYDAGGAVSTVTDGLGKTTTYTLDALGRQTSALDPNLIRTTVLYDAAGEVTTQIDGAGDTTSMAYDAAGRLTQQTDPNVKNTVFSYDGAGRLLTVTDPNNNTTQNFYDQDGRLARQIAPYAANGTPVSDTYFYDAAGRMTAHIDRDGRQDLYNYDADNRTTAVTWKDAAGNTTNQQAFTYDPNGNVLTAGDNNGAYTYSYDLLNRATQVQQPFNESVSYTYDAADRLTVMHDSFGGSTTYTFDAADRVTAVQFSNAGEAMSLTLSYDARNEITGQTRTMYPNGTPAVIGTASYSYDTGGRVTNITDLNGGGALVDSFNYTYDAANRVSTASSTTGPMWTYTYDADGQLLNDGHTSTTYDANGNRSATGTTLGAANELTYDGTYNYTYDAEGNLTTKVAVSNGTTWAYQYDNANRLTQAAEYTPQGGSAAVYKETYKYDVWGNRIEWDVYPSGDSGGAVVTRFEFDPWGNAYADFGTNGLGSMRRVFLPATDALIARWDSNAVVSWYLTDRLGSVRDLVNGSGQLVDYLFYTGWGVLSYESAQASGDRYKYAGREIDVYWNGSAQVVGTTNLEYDRARFRDLFTTRWISQDPKGFAAGDPNLYRNVGNSMPNFTDPSGLQRATIGGPGDMPTGGGGENQRSGLGLVDMAAEFFAYRTMRQPTISEAARQRQLDYTSDGSQVDQRAYFQQVRGWRDEDLQAEIARLRGLGMPLSLPAEQQITVPGLAGDVTMTRSYYAPTAIGARLEVLQGLLGNSIRDAALALENPEHIHSPASRMPVYRTPQFTGLWAQLPLGSSIAGFIHSWENNDPLGVVWNGAMAAMDAWMIYGAARSLLGRAASWLGICFVAGTPVHTTAGLRAIEEVAAGDSVWAFDLVKGSWRPCKVLQTFCRHYEGRKVAVTAAGETVEATYRHPFWVMRGEALELRPRLEHLQDAPAGRTTPGRWVDAGDLRVGDELLLRDGREATVERLAVAAYEGPVYNFDVEDLHCYAVGRDGALVHNWNGAEGIASANMPAWARAGLDDLAAVRAELGPIPGGGLADGGVLARFEVGEQSFLGHNAHGQAISLRVNAITATHAEADVFQQAANAGVKGGAGRLFVDAELCGACGQNGGVRSMARQIGLESLEVITPNGVVSVPLE
jgi:RHS repeat-associated protein